MDEKPDTGSPKQQIVDRIKSVTNILVTVSTDPSVDELSAALGLTIMLNKLDKHATAVFSGKIPPAIEFLDPTKTFENTVDSLRDFIIALDKEKADRLRYRVEDDMVRIFITPYRTVISEEDLQFTHGDFNVELVLALGVENKDMLDGAIAAHGRILHDATVATIDAQNKKSDLGSIGWQDNSASSLCEMLVAVGEALKPSLLDEQIATALLTGIVAATDRFSNGQTSPKAMTMAAQLMAAGANQQLIAAKLEETAAISPEETLEPDGATKLKEGASKKVRDAEKKNKDTPAKSKKDDGALGEITISHDGQEATPEPDESLGLPEVATGTIEEHDQRQKQQAGEEALDAALTQLGASTPQIAASELETELETAAIEEPLPKLPDLPAEPVPAAKPNTSWKDQPIQPPALGSPLNATMEEAEQTMQKEKDSGRNQMIMSHDESDQPIYKGKTIMPPGSDIAAESSAPAASSLADIEAELKDSSPAATPAPQDHVDNARQEIDGIFGSASPAPVSSGVAASTPEPSTLPPLPASQDSLAAPFPPPPLPDFSTLPPLPPADSTSPPLDANGLPLPPGSTTSLPYSEPVVVPNPSEPGQFKIPGQ